MKKYKGKKVVNITGLLVLAQALMQKIIVTRICPKCNQEVSESAFDRATNQCTRCKKSSRGGQK